MILRAGMQFALQPVGGLLEYLLCITPFHLVRRIHPGLLLHGRGNVQHGW